MLNVAPKNHCGFRKFTNEHRALQIKHVKRKRANLLFNVESVKGLPNNKRLLLGMDDGPVAGDR